MTTIFAKARRDANYDIAKAQTAVRLSSGPEVRAAIKCLPPAIRKNASLSISSFGGNVYLGAPINGLDSFKDAVLVKTLERFAGSEWKAHSNDWTGGGAPNRDFSFTRPIGEWVNLTVTIYAYVKSDSPTCRVVTKGIERIVTERPITAIVCD